MTPCSLFLLILLAVSLVGCQGMTMQRHTFPLIWPHSLTLRQSAIASVQETGPAIWVEPLMLDLGEGTPQQAAPAPGVSTSQVLTDLMAQKLQEVGVRVSKEGAEYALVGTVPQLGYTEHGGYPRKLVYTSQLSYHLIHRPTGAVVWKGNLSQDFEQTVLVNTMTKLPEDPSAPEHVLLDKCIDPTWGAIASDIGAFLKKNPLRWTARSR